MQPWLIYAIIAFLMWGIWGFFPKLTVAYIGPKSALVFESIGALIISLIVLVFALKFKPEIHLKGSLFALVTGMAGITGALFFLSSLSAGGKASVVVTLTALYPIVTIALSFFLLHEAITLTQGIGMLLALVAIILISI